MKPRQDDQCVPILHLEQIDKRKCTVLIRRKPMLWVAAQKRQSTRLFIQSFGLGTPIPSPSGECVPSLFGSGGGGTHSLAGEGVGSPSSDEGTDTVVHIGIYLLFG
jgi:hypothetical protein